MKHRLSLSLEPELVRAGEQAVALGHAANLSAWVSEALRLKAAHDQRQAALAALIAAHEAEHGVITPAEVQAAVRRARGRAVVVRPRPARPARKRAAS